MSLLDWWINDVGKPIGKWQFNNIVLPATIAVIQYEFKSSEESISDWDERLGNLSITPEEARDNYFVEQFLQEGVGRALGFSLPWPVKFGLEVYGFYDYFLND